MTKFRTQYNYNLSKITDFNSALIYGFEPEASIKVNNPDYDVNQHPVEHLTHGTNQHEDMFNAYYYAQETILKSIREYGIESITAPNILNWLKEIHAKISLALSEDNDNTNLSGNYTAQQIMRWHHSTTMGFGIQLYFVGMSSKEQLITTADECGLDINVAENFLKILENIYKRKDIAIPDYEKPYITPYINSAIYPAFVAAAKLCNAYKEKMLSDSEKAIVDKVVKICCAPPQIAEKMNVFAINLETAWKLCDKHDVTQVAELCRMAFFEFTEIHPFFNANGRTATCLVNIILRSLGHESILMRNPGDKSDESSSYSLAIEHIDSKPELLRAHFISRINEADNNITYKNEMLETIVQLRLDMTQICAGFNRAFPKFNLLAFWNETGKKASEEIDRFLLQNQIEDLSDEKITLLVLNFIKLKFSNKLKELEDLKAKPVHSSLIKRQYSAVEKQSCLDKIKDLTGFMNWKSYNTNGLSLLLELNDKEKAKQLTDSLKSVDAFKVTYKLRKDTGVPVILIDEINTVQLLKLKTIPGLSDSLEQKMERKVI